MVVGDVVFDAIVMFVVAVGVVIVVFYFFFERTASRVR